MPYDPSLDLPTPTTPVSDLSGPGDTLVHAGAARPRPFMLVSRASSARGVETRGVEIVELDGRFLLGGLGLAGASCGNVLLAPAQARRELSTRVGVLQEVLLVTPEGLIAQWLPAPGASDGELRVVFRLPGDRWSAEGASLRVDAADGARIVRIHPEPEWSVREEAGEMVVSARVSARQGARLVATLGDDGAAASARLRRLTAARAAQADGELTALRTRRLATHTGVAEIDDGIAWALARADALAAPPNTAPGAGLVHELAHGEPTPLDPDSRRAWTALGLLASGRMERPSLAPEAPLALYALARAAEWRGEPMAREARAALTGGAARPETGVDGAAATAWRAALLAAADAVEPWDGKPAAEELRARAGALEATRAPARPGGMRLPTLGARASTGAPTTDPLAALVASALDLPGRAPIGTSGDEPAPGVMRALTAWACFNDGLLDRGFALFRQHVADGFADGVGLWPDGGRIHDPCAAALVPLVLLDGLLGARGAAHHGRLRLAPRLPASWTRFSVSGIPIGEATVRMTYELTERRHRFRFAQESGALPIMLIFEPLVAAASGAGTWVDGSAAELETSAAHGRVRVKVQLPLDHEREVAIAAS